MQMKRQTPSAETAAPRGRSPRIIEGVRICAADGCDTRLTAYNRDDACYRHQAPRFPQIRN